MDPSGAQVLFLFLFLLPAHAIAEGEQQPRAKETKAVTLEYTNDLAGTYKETATIKGRIVTRSNYFSMTWQSFKNEPGNALLKYESEPRYCIVHPTLVTWEVENQLIGDHSPNRHPDTQLVQVEVPQMAARSKNPKRKEAKKKAKHIAKDYAKRLLGVNIYRHCKGKKLIFTAIAKSTQDGPKLNLVMTAGATATITLLKAKDLDFSYPSQG